MSQSNDLLLVGSVAELFACRAQLDKVVDDLRAAGFSHAGNDLVWVLDQCDAAERAFQAEFIHRRELILAAARGEDLARFRKEFS
jgi:hypothetical protein